jgi:hypothetical protein
MIFGVVKGFYKDILFLLPQMMGNHPKCYYAIRAENVEISELGFDRNASVSKEKYQL